MPVKLTRSKQGQLAQQDVDELWKLFIGIHETWDSDALTEGGLTAASAGDEEDGAITYLKGRYKSLIDHIFLLPNLARQYGEDDFFILAADHPDPRDFICNIGDHRPVLMRFSLSDTQDENVNSEEAVQVDPDALAELKRFLNAKEGQPHKYKGKNRHA